MGEDDERLRMKLLGRALRSYNAPDEDTNWRLIWLIVFLIGLVVLAAW